MDLSDGLARDAARLAATSGVAVELDLAALPLHRDARRAARVSGKSPVEHALHDGEDHELLALLPERTWRRLAGRPEFQAARVVGRALAGRGLWLLDGGVRRRWDGAGGWTHGE
jgi:thiamine-monophosphate kinase